MKDEVLKYYTVIVRYASDDIYFKDSVELSTMSRCFGVDSHPRRALRFGLDGCDVRASIAFLRVSLAGKWGFFWKCRPIIHNARVLGNFGKTDPCRDIFVGVCVGMWGCGGSVCV